MYKPKELRDRSLEELKALYDESCKKLFELQNEFRAQKKREKPHEIRHTRKDIARLLTIVTEKQHQNPKSV